MFVDLLYKMSLIYYYTSYLQKTIFDIIFDIKGVISSAMAMFERIFSGVLPTNL